MSTTTSHNDIMFIHKYIHMILVKNNRFLPNMKLNCITHKGKETYLEILSITAGSCMIYLHRYILHTSIN